MRFIKLHRPDKSSFFLNMSAIASFGRVGDESHLCEVGVGDSDYVATETPDEILALLREEDGHE